MIKFATRSTRLSKFDHRTGEYVEKPLHQRWHGFADGRRVQPDLYSGWLARFVEGDHLDASQCLKHRAAEEPLLQRAASSFPNLRAGAGFSLPHVPVTRKGAVALERIAC